MNCHYVTRSLTKPWEHDSGRLFYFDFPTGTIREGRAKTLFALEDTLSLEMEQMISRLVEHPLSVFREVIHNGQGSSISDWATYRALFLYFLMQSERFRISKLDHQATPTSIFGKDEAFIDQLISVMMETYNVLWIGMPTGHVLFFPESGVFQFPTEDAECVTGFTFSLAVPLTPFMALAMVPKTIAVDRLFEQRAQLQGYSVGVNENASRILIPKVVTDNNKNEILIETITNYRKAGIEVTKATHEIRELTVKMYDLAGLSLGPIKPTALWEPSG